jgi:lipopolysaccharide biosynthesis regulator YciM
MASRLQQLERFAKEDPHDPFNLYVLALEYSKSDVGKAVETFTQLLNEHAHYVPTYYHLGKLYVDISENEKALAVFDAGIKVATHEKDHKALRELQSARQELLFDLDD